MTELFLASVYFAIDGLGFLAIGFVVWWGASQYVGPYIALLCVVYFILGSLTDRLSRRLAQMMRRRKTASAAS